MDDQPAFGPLAEGNATMATKVRTYTNTSFKEWRSKAEQAFDARGLDAPTMDATRDAFDMGESPETWADYVAGSRG